MNVSISVLDSGDVEVLVSVPVSASGPTPAPEVEIAGDECNVLVVTVEGLPTPLTVPLPASVAPDTARVRWRAKTGRLTFTAARAVDAAVAASPVPESETATETLNVADARPHGPADAACAATRVPAAEAKRGSATLPSTAAEGPTAAAAPAAADGGTAGACASSHSTSDRGTAAGAVKAGSPPPTSTVSAPAPAAAAVAPAAATAASPVEPGTASSSGGPPTTSSPARGATATPATSATAAGAGAAAAAAADDVALYADFYCNSPPAVPAPSRNLHEGSPAASGGACGASLGTPTRSNDSFQSGGATSSNTSNGSLSNGNGHRSGRAGGTSTSTSTSTSGASGSAAGGGRDDDTGSGGVDSGVGVRGDARVNAAKVAAAFGPTGGTASRDAGFSFTAPDLPPPPPLPAGLPPVAAAIDCRYLAVANGLRITAHAQTAAMAELLGLRKAPSTAAAARQRERCAALLDRVAASLDAYGYAVLDNYISEDAIRAARKELEVMQEHYSAGLIWVGKEAEAGAQISVSSVRGDVVLWLDDQALGATAFVKEGVRRPCSFLQLQQLLADVDELVFEGLRPRLGYLAGLHRRSDAMMAIYPGKGARFAKHIDNTTMDGRRLTVLTYLNPGWKEEQGGALRLFPVRQGAAEQVDVLPVAGRVALFLSAEVAHEVMPTHGAAQRHAVTLWYFDAGEHAAALAAARVMPGATSKPSAQAAATALLRDLLAEESASGIPETKEGCTALGTRVAGLEAGAQQLLAAVLGLPSANALVESFRGLTPSTLRQRREELRNMGLNQQHHAPDTTSHMMTHGR
ncbi:hypothetical protein HYH02_010725 [Chlamydomonas schloesseri]|uniref:Fe2OG dioxygenase domain-containing protein n=1 Tax=Chlamydomonas schloesseri TaxID=2026947 RepID=A0A835T7M0_9CHLO|nr:hypothetical protein HYH02_010725 [Chlamydomonas schloesseri]|eukprot:KAG2438931.1 hypothetical protein HYH02_010725 [Chlamydomonas schloesseri]